MSVANQRPEAPTAIRTDLGAIFTSLELSHSKWLITSLSPGSEKMSKHVVAAGNVAGLLDRFAELRRKAEARTGRCYPIIVIQEAGLDGFWIHRVLQPRGSKATSSMPPRLQPRAGGAEPRPTGSTVRRWSGRCWPTSEASHGCARWSGRRRRRMKTVAASRVSARP